MKKLFPIILMAVFMHMGCQDEGDKNQANPALLMTLGPHTLTVNVVYNGPYDLYSTPGTGKVYVYLYQSIGSNTRSPLATFTASSAGAVTDTTRQTFTFSGIAAGTYYILAAYDFAGGANMDNQRDRYVLYSNVSCSASATPIILLGDQSIDIAFSNTYSLIAPAGTFVCP